MCGPSVIGSKSLIHFVGRSFWQVISDGCTPSSFVGEPRLTAAFPTTSNRYARTTKGLLVAVLREMAGLAPIGTLENSLLGAQELPFSSAYHSPATAILQMK